MREIKFRGKRTDNDEWVFGLYVKSVNDRAYIIVYATEDAVNTRNEIDFLYIEVIPETVGQFTGLKDKNGKEIYEGDVIKASGNWRPAPTISVIEWGDLMWAAGKDPLQYFIRYGENGEMKIDDGCSIEAIGNIHDKEE